MDEDLNPWLLEVNANPSLNVYSDAISNDNEQQLSEIDKYVKMNLVSDTLKIMTTAPLFASQSKQK